jgi:nitrilase
MNERGSRAGRGTVWCSLVTIDAQKGVLGSHRKLMPTLYEKLCWGIGDARDLRTHPFGNFRVGGLNCWENWMPLTRNAMYEDGEDVHISVWPGNPGVVHNLPEVVAHEGRVWAAGIAGVLSMSDVPSDFEFYDDLIAAGHDVIFAGGSRIVSPQGEVVASIPPGAEGIAQFEIDLQSVRRARQDFDVAGHYARPDIFEVSIRRARAGDAAAR